MAMIWSSRERNRSCSPLARRSRGRIQTSVRSNRPHQRVRVCDSKESPDPILQEKPVTGHEFRQNETPEFAALPLKNRGILKFSQSTKSSHKKTEWPACKRIGPFSYGARRRGTIS